MRRSSSATPRANRHSQYLLACVLAAAFPLTSLAATDNWTNTAGGFYFTATNWSSNPNIPGDADTVVFNLPNSYTVQFDSGPTNTNFLFQQGTVTWLAANAPQTYTLTSASGPVISGGKLTLGNASAPALTVAITGGLAVEGTSAAILNVNNNSILNAGNIDIGDNGLTSNNGTIDVGATVTQSGNSTLTIGAATKSTGTLDVAAGTYTTGAGLTTINAKGKITLAGGSFNLNGNLTVTGGCFTQTAGNIAWAASHTMTIQSGGNVSLAGVSPALTSATINVTGNGTQLNDTGSTTANLGVNNGSTLSVTGGASVHSDQYLDIGATGNGTVTVDGVGSSFSTAATSAEDFLGTGGTGTLTFSTSATGSAPGGFAIATNAGSSGTLNVQSSAVLTTGGLDVADLNPSGTGIINVTGGTLTQTGNSYLTVGQDLAFGGTATVNIGNATTSGTFTTGTGLTYIGATGNINLFAGTFNLNGNLTVTGGSFTQTGGTFTWADSQTMTIQSGGVVTLAQLFLTPANAVINITGNGSRLEDTGSNSFRVLNGATVSVTSGGTLMGDTFLNIGFGTVTIDGFGSSFSTGAPAFASENAIGNFGNAGTLTFSSLATGSVPNGFELGLTAGSSGTLNVQSNATLTCGPLDVADAGVPVTGVINVVGGTLIQSDVAPLTVGQDLASGGTATVNIGNATTSGNFTTGTGDISIGATGTIDLIAGTFNINGNVTNSGTLTLAGAQTWAATTSLTNTAGKTTFSSSAKLYGLSITGGTVDLTTAKLIVEAASNKSATLTTLRTDVTNASLLSSTAAAANTLAGRTDQVVVVSDNAIRMAAFPTGSTTFGGNPADANSILITATYLGDANLDGQVNILDLQDLANHWQQSVTDWSQADFNGDGLVNILDLQALANHWQFGTTGGGSGSDQSFSQALALLPQFSASAPAPEPASLLLLSPLLLLTRRRARPCPSSPVSHKTLLHKPR